MRGLDNEPFAQKVRRKKTKKRIGILFLALMLMGMATAAAQQAYVRTGNHKPVNVRSSASQKAQIVARLENGTTVEVNRLVGDGTWAEITYGQHTGYCMTVFLGMDSLAVCRGVDYTIEYDESLFTYESSGGTDTYWWSAQEADKPNCFMSLSILTDFTAEKAIEGLALQSGVEGERYSVMLGGREAPAYTFSEGMEAGSRLVEYVCVPRSDGSTLLIELDNYIGAEETIGQVMQEMLESMTFPGESQGGQTAQNEGRAQCPDCGQWFEAGNVYRNHVCPARQQADETEYVQCPDCGQWFEAGNVYRNHICPARQQAEEAEEEYVQCDVCGEWFRAGNEFRNHICVTYPSEDNMAS